MPSLPKARQASKIKEIGQALTNFGIATLDQQAKALGLPRSTTWTVLRASHKGSGLSAHVINKMLAAPDLPAVAREKIVSYVEERLAGLHGHSRTQRDRFARRLSISMRGSGFDFLREIHRDDQSSHGLDDLQVPGEIAATSSLGKRERG
jgi:hypothetical protein